MFKIIPGSLEYRINLKREIIDGYGVIVNPSSNLNGSTKIDLFGKSTKVMYLHLSLLAWYEAGSIFNLQEHLGKIQFNRTDFKTIGVKCGYVMTFAEPIYFKEGFRYIPSFPRYAVDIHGTVIDTQTNEVIPINHITDDGYPVVYIRNPDKCGNRNTRLHRLIALAWLPNTDFINKPIVNHIDGNKLNYKLSNLEWCNNSHNVKHAVSTGLRSDLIPMKTRDVVSGEVVIYKTATEMALKLGMTGVRALGILNSLPGYLYKKRYEIKALEDNSPWFYEQVENLTDLGVKAIFTITVLDKNTGNSKKFMNVKTFYKTYCIWPRSGTLDEAVIIFKDKYKDFDISYKRNSIVGPYRVKDIETENMVIFDSIWEVGECIGRSRTEIQYDLSRGRKFIYSNKWIIALGDEEIVLSEYSLKPKNKMEVMIVETVTKVETKATSIKQAAKITGLDVKTITKHFNTGNIIKGYLFRALE